MSQDPYAVIKQFERDLSEYTGAPYVVCVNSCSAALFLALYWHILIKIEIQVPKHTYISVPMAVHLAGGVVEWVDKKWRGAYQLKPLSIWDCARRFTSGMYKAGQFQCISFSASKILGMEQGGAILHDDKEADKWFRKMRSDGRTDGLEVKDDKFEFCGYHCFMTPSVAAQGILRLHYMPKHNPDLPDYPYPDLSKICSFLG